MHGVGVWGWMCRSARHDARQCNEYAAGMMQGATYGKQGATRCQAGIKGVHRRRAACQRAPPAVWLPLLPFAVAAAV